MNKFSKRYQGFPASINLVLADILLAVMLGVIFLSIMPPNNKGLLLKLAPYTYETKDTLSIPSSAIIHLEIDSTSQLFVDRTPHTLLNAEEKIEDFLLMRLLANRKSYIWLRTHRHAKYRHYIQLRDVIMRVENTLLNDLCIRFYGEKYSPDIPVSWRERLSNKISICIIEEDELGKPYFEPKSFCDC